MLVRLMTRVKINLSQIKTLSSLNKSNANIYTPHSSLVRTIFKTTTHYSYSNLQWLLFKKERDMCRLHMKLLILFSQNNLLKYAHIWKENVFS